MKKENEVWLPITKPINYSWLYEVSNLGRIKSLKRETNNQHCSLNKILLPNKGRHGYYLIGLSKDGFETKHSVHRLVALNFIPNPENKPQVNHKDGNKTNNVLSNLEWNTRSENLLHAHKIGIKKGLVGEVNHFCKLKEFEVLQIKDLLKIMKQKHIAELYNLSATAITYIKNGKNWSHL